jgi:hypothetical protein
MRRRGSLLTIALVCAIGVLSGELTQAAVHSQARNGGSIQPGIAVLVYNYAAVPAFAMSRVREKVNRLYRDAGVEIEWLDPSASRCSVGETSNPSHPFTVQILIRSMRGFRGPSTLQSVMGEALPPDENGGMLFLYYDQVVRVARQYNRPLADILGLAIAHEMGHLLLPVHAHSSTGIMRADWDGDDIRRGVVGSLVFTSAEAALIRARVQGCCLHGAKSREADGVVDCQLDE